MNTVLKYSQFAMVVYTVNNIKVSFKVSAENIQQLLKALAKHSDNVSKRDINFFVLRKKFVYIIFFTGHINCTKIRSLDEASKCKLEFIELFQEKVRASITLHEIKVDNISSSGCFEEGKVSLTRLAIFLQNSNIISRFNPETFPGLSLRICSVTFTIFSSGKFIAVGAKEFVDLSISVNIFERYLKSFFCQRKNEPTYELRD